MGTPVEQLITVLQSQAWAPGSHADGILLLCQPSTQPCSISAFKVFSFSSNDTVSASSAFLFLWSVPKSKFALAFNSPTQKERWVILHGPIPQDKRDRGGVQWCSVGPLGLRISSPTAFWLHQLWPLPVRSPEINTFLGKHSPWRSKLLPFS